MSKWKMTWIPETRKNHALEKKNKDDMSYFPYTPRQPWTTTPMQRKEKNYKH